MVLKSEAQLNRFVISAVSLLLLGACGCFDSYAPDKKNVARASITREAIEEYLSEAQLARPVVVREVTDHLRRGATYRNRIRDQKNRWCLTTVYIDQVNTLHVVTHRDEPCPTCNGTGKRKFDNETLKKSPFDFRCVKCNGKGFIENHTVERKYALAVMDYVDSKKAGILQEQMTYKNAPAGTRERVSDLASKDPRQRLAACVWLDKYYIKKGIHFQKLLPMLKKARWQEADKKKMVWEFWAGKDITGEAPRAYYRIYADSHNGKVVAKGFYPER